MTKKTEAAMWFCTGVALMTGAFSPAWGAMGGLALLGVCALSEGLTSRRSDDGGRN